MTDPFVISDVKHGGTRTIVLDMPFPDFLHALFKSDAYLWHIKQTAGCDVGLRTDAGMKTAKIYPHDGDCSPQTFEDFFPDDDTGLPRQDKVGITFVSFNDWDQLDAVAERTIQIGCDAPTYSQ